MGRFRALAKLWGVTESQAKNIAETAPPWFTRRVDLALDQPSRAAGRFGQAANPGRHVKSGLKTVGYGVGAGGVGIGGAEAYKSFNDRQIAAEENAVDQARADAMASLLSDPSMDEKETLEIIDSLDKAGFFDDTDLTPETWYQKLGLEGGLNPVTFFGGGLSGVVVFLIVVWAVVRIAQSR